MTTAAAKTERGIALVAAAMRGVVLIQILVGTPGGARLARYPAAYLALSGAVVLVCGGLVIQCLRSRAVQAGSWRLPDLALAWLAVPSMNLLLPATHVVGTWEAWAPGYAVNVAALASTWLRTTTSVVHAFALGGWCLGWMLAAHETSWETAVNNALTVPGYAVVVALMVASLRALAVEADRARDDAVRAAHALELERYQLTVHDASSILRLLSDDETPAAVLPGLRRQADREARRLRTYLGRSPQPLPPGSGPPGETIGWTVGTMLESALDGFDDLPVVHAAELGSHAILAAETWVVVRDAVTTVLHNVRHHAAAHQVVVHADCNDSLWEVVISDDGAGFDAAHQPLGFGLGTQVRKALTSLGITASIVSSPGQGTSVTIVGQREGQK